MENKSINPVNTTTEHNHIERGELTYEDKVIQKIIGYALKDAVDLDVVVEYGKDIENIYDQIKELISTEVNEMTHLDVIEVNVNVVDIKTQEEYEKDQETVQDKVTGAAKSTGQFASKQTDKAKAAVNKGTQKVKENNEPRVQ